MRIRNLLAVVLFVSNACVSANQEALFGIDWTGTKALRSGDLPTALKEMLIQPVADDTIYRDFKLGIVYFHLQNYSSSLTLLRNVVETRPDLAPVVYVYIAEIEKELGRTGNCLAAYRSALRGEIPPRYRHYIYEKLRVIIEADSTLGIQQAPWLEEYYRWSAPRQEDVVFTTVDTVKTLLREKRWTVVDSLLVNNLLAGDHACDIVKEVRAALDDDSLSVGALFNCARKAHACGELTIASQFFEKLEKRPGVFDTIRKQEFDGAMAGLYYDKQEWREAIRQYKKNVNRYGKSADAYMSIARAYRKLGNESEAAVWYEKLMAAFPRHPKTQEILWLRAWQNEDRKRYQKAANYYRRIISRYPQGNRVDESYLRYALCFYNEEKYDSARLILEGFVNKKQSSTKLLAAYYWQAKCYLATGQKFDAMTILRLVFRKDPFDYYAHRSRQLLLELGDTTEVFIDTMCTGRDVLAWFDSLSSKGVDQKEFTSRDSLYYRCGIYLASVGDIDKADYFLEPIELSFPGNLTLQYTLALLYMRVGASAPAFRIARRLTWRIPESDRSELPLDVYKLFYPPFFAEFIRKEAKNYNVDPFLISGVMRQESIFNPKIVSPAGAIGLMQIMPYTGKYIAEKKKTPFTSDSLYSAEYNIRFGVYYVHELLEQFDGNKMLALAAYNAGPHNAKRWAKAGRNKELDLFVEDIGFTETRGYVKKVMANYWTYEFLSGYGSYTYSTATLEQMSSLPPSTNSHAE
ncbi:MAG: transglycosylase SLT domain-containing protein [Chitinispirillaceae bacterium]|nr:transglycosylase SLT domain-containing protein [Chitinispirillaceae bacterium]